MRVNRSIGGLTVARLAFFCGLSLAGCTNSKSKEIPASTTTITTSVQARVELSEATARIDELHVLRVDVKYRFAEGKPNKFYMCEITFPGTDRNGLKAMEAWELQTSGVIKAGIELQEGEVLKEFKVSFAEANSPDQGYKTISNSIEGIVAAPG